MEPVRGRVESVIQQATLALDRDEIQARVKQGGKLPGWVIGSAKIQDISRFDGGLDETPELSAVLEYLRVGPEAAAAAAAMNDAASSSSSSSLVAIPQPPCANECDLLYHEILSAAMHSLMLEASLIVDPVDFTSVLRRVCSWFQDMRLNFSFLEAERNQADKKAKLKESLRQELQIQGIYAPHTMTGLGGGATMTNTSDRRGSGGSTLRSSSRRPSNSSSSGSQRQHQESIAEEDKWHLGAIHKAGDLDMKCVPPCCLKKVAAQSNNGSFFKLKDIAMAHAQRLSRMTSPGKVVMMEEEVDAFLQELRDARAKREPRRESLHNALLAAEAEAARSVVSLLERQREELLVVRQQEEEEEAQAAARRHAQMLQHSESKSLEAMEERWLKKGERGGTTDSGERVVQDMLDEAKDQVGAWVARQNLKEAAREEQSHIRRLVGQKSRAFLERFGVRDDGDNSANMVPTATMCGGVTAALAKAQENYLLHDKRPQAAMVVEQRPHTVPTASCSSSLSSSQQHFPAQFNATNTNAVVVAELPPDAVVRRRTVVVKDDDDSYLDDGGYGGDLSSEGSATMRAILMGRNNIHDQHSTAGARSETSPTTAAETQSFFAATRKKEEDPLLSATTSRAITGSSMRLTIHSPNKTTLLPQQQQLPFPLSSMYYRKELLDRKSELTPRTAAAAAERSKELSSYYSRSRKPLPRVYVQAEDFMRHHFLSPKASSSSRGAGQVAEVESIVQRLAAKNLGKTLQAELLQRALVVPPDKPPEVLRLNFLEPGAGLMENPRESPTNKAKTGGGAGGLTKKHKKAGKKKKKKKKKKASK